MAASGPRLLSPADLNALHPEDLRRITWHNGVPPVLKKKRDAPRGVYLSGRRSHLGIGSSSGTRLVEGSLRVRSHALIRL